MEEREQIDTLELAKLVEFNAKAESQAIFDYTEMMKRVIEMENVSRETKDKIIDDLSEIVSDELNHKKVLLELYTYLTNIEPNKD